MGWDVRTNMRTGIIIYFLCFTVMGAAQDNEGEKSATIRLTNITLESALTILAASYNVTFAYSDNLVALQSRVDLQIEDETIEPALTKLLSPFGIDFKRINATRIVFRRQISPFTQTVRGVITDEATGTPIPGVTVLIKNTNPLLGTATDDQGRFRITDVPAGRISMSITGVGWEAREISGLLLGTGKELVLNISLSELKFGRSCTYGHSICRNSRRQ
jgi:hypothetical protein